MNRLCTFSNSRSIIRPITSSNFPKRGAHFPLSLEEKAGVRTVVVTNIFSPHRVGGVREVCLCFADRLCKLGQMKLAWITGANGLIGSYLVQTAPRFVPGWRVRALTRADL